MSEPGVVVLVSIEEIRRGGSCSEPALFNRRRKLRAQARTVLDTGYGIIAAARGDSGLFAVPCAGVSLTEALKKGLVGVDKT